MAGRSKLKEKYESIHRFMAGLAVSCFIVTVLGSALSGARVITITYRGVVVILILSVIGRILIRTWVSMDDLKQSARVRSVRGESDSSDSDGE